MDMGGYHYGQNECKTPGCSNSTWTGFGYNPRGWCIPCDTKFRQEREASNLRIMDAVGMAFVILFVGSCFFGLEWR
jgi:hypothetical protein